MSNYFLTFHEDKSGLLSRQNRLVPRGVRATAGRERSARGGRGAHAPDHCRGVGDQQRQGLAPGPGHATGRSVF